MCNTMLACSFPSKDCVVNGSNYSVSVSHSVIAGVMGDVSCFSRAASLRRGQSCVQQLFQSSSACWRDTGDTRQCGGVSTQQVMQAAKSRDYCAGVNGPHASQVVVAHAQWGHLHVHLRHGGQKSGDAGTLFLRVDANMDWNWWLFRHRLYGFSSF